MMGDAETSGMQPMDGEPSANHRQSSTSVAEDKPEVQPETIIEEPGTSEVSESKEERATNSRVNSTICNQDLLDVPDKDPEDVSLRSVSDGENSVFSDNPDCSNQQQSAPEGNKHPESENESEELDDIELIFTTDETCRDVGLQEDLVSITENESWQNNGGQPILLKYTKSAEGEAPVCNGDKTSSVDEAASSQSSSIDREESVDRFDESSSTRLNKMWSQCSVLVETDISKCGVVEEPDHSARHAARRNTLAAPPTAYR